MNPQTRSRLGPRAERPLLELDEAVALARAELAQE